MSGDCHDINPLQHSGTSQEQRAPAALNPASAPVDSRSYADLILFAKAYGSYLKYYDATDTPAGTWQALMQMDIAVVLATLASDRMPLYETYRTGIYTEIFQVDANDAVHQPENETLCRQLLEAVFDVLFTYLYHLDEQYRLLPAGSDESSFIHSMIAGKLKEACLRLTAYYQQASAASLLIAATVYIPPQLIPPCTIRLAPALLSTPLGNGWQGSLPALPPLHGSGIIRQVKNLVSDNLFNSAVDTILKSIGSIASYAAGRLDATLAHFPSHTPHYALFLTFIQLFRHAQDDLNGLTEKHLGFYYRQVLQLHNRPAESDRVDLVIQLQKNIPRLLIPGGTAFKAGKDGDGQEMFYATTRDFTVNQASVQSLRALYVQNAADPVKGKYQTLFSSPVANSGDGAGGPALSDDGSWFSFGSPDHTAGLGQTGFAIASPQLYLGEGKRTISVQVTLQQNVLLTATLLQNAFQVQITGEKGWITADAASVAVYAKTNTLSFTVSLDSGTDAVTGFNAKVHPGLFSTSLPVMKFLVNMARNTFNPLAALGMLKVTRIALSVQVQGLRNLQLHTDTGAADPSKPFMPFTSSPHTGSSFLIGSKEVLEKPLTSLQVVIGWDKLPPEGLDIYEKKNDLIYNGFQLQDVANAAAAAGENINQYVGEHDSFYIGGHAAQIFFRKHTVLTSWLRNGVWQDEPAARGLFSGKELFYSGDFHTSWPRPPAKYAQTAGLSGAAAGQTGEDLISCPLSRYSAAVFDSQEPEKFSNRTTNGFLRLALAGDDFAHDAYLKQLMNVSITTSGNTQTISNRPDPPYTPVVKFIEVNYTASGDLLLSGDASVDAFYSLYPFGIQDQDGSGFPLVPVYSNEGELYIGLENVVPPENVSLLFQLSEGSASPLKQPQPVQWSYLSSANRWTPLEQADLQDHTHGLLESGLLIFSIPPDAATDASGIGAPLMGGSLTWLRAAVVHDSDAICKIISVQAQGIEASFADIHGTGNYYKAPLPAGTISKLVFSNALIRTISQPYSSFGGRPLESDPDFYARISERLRHKGRGISIWDYEHLVLQQFPDIYKVKCLNHTGLRQPQGQGSEAASLNEAWPGHVTVVPVPNLLGRNATDPLLPYTPLGTLEDIGRFLSTRISPFVQLDVLNPQFEEVQFDFKVRFLTGYDATVYSTLLNDGIAEFLSPWAFEAGADIEFGGKIDKSVVLKFIEDQYYVDYVTCFRMNHWTDIAAGAVQYNVEEAVATTSRSILVSYHNPDTGEKHRIQPILTETVTCDCP